MCPGAPACPVCVPSPVCVPCVSRLPPVFFYLFSPNGKKTPGGAGTHTRETGQTHRGHTGAHARRTRAHGSHRRTREKNLTTIQSSKPTNTPARPHDRAMTDSAADSTAAAPEPNAPRSRLRRGRPQHWPPANPTDPAASRSRTGIWQRAIVGVVRATTKSSLYINNKQPITGSLSRVLDSRQTCQTCQKST